MAKDVIVTEKDQTGSRVEKPLVVRKLHKRAKQASLLTFALPLAACGGDDTSSSGGASGLAGQPGLRLVSRDGVFAATGAVEQGGAAQRHAATAVARAFPSGHKATDNPCQ